MKTVLVYKTVRRPIGISVREITKTVEAVLGRTKESGEVSVHFIADKRMRTLNREYRGIDRTTDVLAFAAREGDMPMLGDDLGDLFISIPKIKKQAKEHKISFREECLRMLIHGTLHLLGYDHMKKSEAKVMFGLQEEILAGRL